MALRTAGSVLVVFLWSVTVVLGQNGWSVTYTTQSICALKGSTVNLTSYYTYPRDYTVKTTFWFTKMETGKEPEDLGQDPEYAGRLEYHGDKKNGHTLRITDLRESDSATYKFRFITDKTGGKYYGDPGVTLSVTGLQVKVTGGHQDKTLTCSTTCTDNPTYIWYKNGTIVKEGASSLYSDSFRDADIYSCAVKGHEDLHSPPVCQKCWRVTYTHQSICALKGSTVDMSCSYTYPWNHEIKTAFWFTKWESGIDPKDLSSVPEYEGHIEYLGDKESDCTLRITDLRLSDSAGYRFRFITSGGRFAGSPVSLTVTDVVLEMDPTSVSERENVTLTCRTRCTLDPITAYSWYKNGQPIPNSSTYSPVYSLFSVSSEDTGRYSCAVEGHEYLPSAEETLTVTYGPKNTSVSVSPSGEIVEGSSVTLTCSSDANPPVQSYTWWYKKNGGGSQNMTGPHHVFNQIQSSDSGQYYCEAQNVMGTDRSMTMNMDVKYGPKSTSVSVSPSGGIVEGSSVTLTCSSDANPPVDTYTWYFQNKTFSNGFGQMYNISNFKSKDNGHYHCEAWNGRGSRNSTTLMIILPGKQTSVVTVAVGITVVVLVLILCISGLMCFMNKSSKSNYDTRDTSENVQGDSSPVYENISSMTMTPTAAQTAATVDQDDVHYASVHFSRKKQEVPLYSTIQLPQPQKQEEDVQYDAVKFNCPSAATHSFICCCSLDEKTMMSLISRRVDP